MTHGRAYSLLFLVTLLWAGNFPFGKLALTELGPITLTAARALVAAPLLVLAARLAYGPLPAGGSAIPSPSGTTRGSCSRWARC